MTVWVLYVVDYTDSYIHSIYATVDLAKSAGEKLWRDDVKVRRMEPRYFPGWNKRNSGFVLFLGTYHSYSLRPFVVNGYTQETNHADEP